MTEEDISGLDGLHFHTLCEQDADALAETRDYDPLLRRVTAGSLWQFRR